MGFRIFALCLRQLYINWLVAIRLSWFWMLAMVLGFLAYSATFSSSISGSPEEGFEFTGNGFLILLTGLAAFVIMFVGFATIAIGWHRWVLRDEEPTVFVVRRGWPLLSYILRSLAIAAIILLAMIIPLVLMVIFIGGSVMMETDASVGFSPGVLAMISIFYLLMATLAIWITLRIGLILPAVAVGDRLSIGQSFDLTGSIAGPLFVTALCVVLFQWIPTVFELLISTAGLADSFLGTIATILSLVFLWISFFVSFGILTVAYGHVVENRPI